MGIRQRPKQRYPFPKNRETDKNRAEKVDFDFVSRHPLTLILISFIFSAIIGGTISRHYDSLEQLQNDSFKRKEFITQLSETAAAYISTINLTIRSIRNNQPANQITSNIDRYETSKINWEKYILTIELTLKQSTISEENTRSLRNISIADMNKSLMSMDHCLRASLKEKSTQKQNEALDRCPHATNISTQYVNNYFTSPRSFEERSKISEICLTQMVKFLYTLSTITEEKESSETHNIKSCENTGNATLAPLHPAGR